MRDHGGPKIMVGWFMPRSFMFRGCDKAFRGALIHVASADTSAAYSAYVAAGNNDFRDTKLHVKIKS